jgi:serine/threonine-protein kinase
MRLTFDPGENSSPVWTPDGTRIVFGGELSDGGPGLFWTRADGAGTVERLTSERALPTPTAFTPDGGRLLFHSANNPRDIAVVTLTGRRNGELLLQTASDEANAEVSPDGKWLAYQSDESGRSEIYVRPFPNITAGRWQVSSGGGSRPMWARNGRALFYTTTPLLTLMEVPIEPGTGFVAGTPRIVLKGPNRYVAPQYGRPYDVTANGQRFLMLRTDAVPPAAGGSTSQQLILVHNWFQELKRLVPVD